MNLTPTEQAEVARFGVHDEDVLEWMELHADEVVPCGRCDTEAHWRITPKCCPNPNHLLACHSHFLGWFRSVKRLSGRHVTCRFCGHDGILTLDWYRVGEL